MREQLEKLVETWREKRNALIRGADVRSDPYDDPAHEKRVAAGQLDDCAKALAALLDAVLAPTASDPERARDLLRTWIAEDQSAEQAMEAAVAADYAAPVREPGPAIKPPRFDAASDCDEVWFEQSSAGRWVAWADVEAVLAENRAKVARLQAWKDAVIDACVVSEIYQNEHEHDPRKALNDVVVWHQAVVLNPAVSEQAREMVERAEKAEAALAESRAEVERLKEWQSAEIRERQEVAARLERQIEAREKAEAECARLRKGLTQLLDWVRHYAPKADLERACAFVAEVLGAQE